MGAKRYRWEEPVAVKVGPDVVNKALVSMPVGICDALEEVMQEMVDKAFDAVKKSASEEREENERCEQEDCRFGREDC